MFKCSFILAYYKTKEHLSTLSSIGSVIKAAFTFPALKENYIEPFGKEILESTWDCVMQLFKKPAHAKKPCLHYVKLMQGINLEAELSGLWTFYLRSACMVQIAIWWDKQILHAFLWTLLKEWTHNSSQQVILHSTRTNLLQFYSVKDATMQ